MTAIVTGLGLDHELGVRSLVELHKAVVSGWTSWVFVSEDTEHCQQCPWRLQHVEGKGIGVFAVRPIARGERILRELPLLVCAATDGDGRLSTNEIERKVSSLSPAKRATYDALMQSELLYGPRKTALGVWRSNAYPTNQVSKIDGSGQKEAAVFEIACRVNHSCAPNCHTAWSEALDELTIHAVKPISKGDEILNSYMEVANYGREERQSHLQRKLGFFCRCAQCSVPAGAQLEASDARRSRLGEIEGSLATVEVEDSAAVKRRQEALVAEKMRLLLGEGLPMEWAHMDMVKAVSCCCAVGDFDAAQKWLLRAMKASCTMLGADSKVVTDLKAVLAQRP